MRQKHGQMVCLHHIATTLSTTGVSSHNFNRFNISIFLQNDLHDQLLVVHMSKIYNKDKITWHRLQWRRLARVRMNDLCLLIVACVITIYTYSGGHIH